MAEKNIKSRIVHKHDTAANWALATNFTPKQGEIIVYDIDTTHSYERVKIGDGVTNVNDLPFYAGSWEDLDNKPFWVEEPTVVEWDGNTDGLAVSSNNTNYKVSDLQPSLTEVIGGKLTFSNGSVVEITSDIIEGEGYIISIYYGTIYINTTSGSAYDYSLSVTLPEPGIYFQKNTYNQLVSFSYGNEVIHVLDEKYIPDTIARVSDLNSVSSLVGDTSVSDQISTAIAEIPTPVQSDWNQNSTTTLDYVKNRPFYDSIKTELMYVSSSNQPTATTLNNGLYYGTTTGSSTTIQNGSKYKITISNSKYSSTIFTCTRAKLSGVYQYCNVLGNAKLGVDIGFLDGNNSSYPIVDTGEDFCFLSYSSTAKNAIISTNQNVRISAFYTVTGELKTIDEKFIPDTVARVADIPDGVSIDETLAIAGQAADAKVTGDAISELNDLVGDTKVSEQISTAIGGIPMADDNNDGLMSSSDKKKLDVVYTQAQVDELIAAVRAACMPKVTTEPLFVDEWTYSGGEYYYDIRLSYLTANSQVNLQVDATSLAILQDDGIALVPVTYSSYVRIWTVGGSPREDITVQITVQEVVEV